MYQNLLLLCMNFYNYRLLKSEALNNRNDKDETEVHTILRPKICAST